MRNTSNIFNYYKINLKSKKIKLVEYDSHANYCYVQALVKNRNNFFKYCEKRGIKSHPGLRCISETKNKKLKLKSIKNSENFSKRSVRLPCGPGYKLSELKGIIRILNEY